MTPLDPCGCKACARPKRSRLRIAVLILGTLAVTALFHAIGFRGW